MLSLVLFDEVAQYIEQRFYIAFGETVICFLDQRHVVSHSLPLSKV